MQAEEPQAENLLLVDEVAQVRAGEARARGAAAGASSGAVAREACVSKVEPALPVSARRCAPFRVGSTQSNMSMPRAITSRTLPDRRRP